MSAKRRNPLLGRHRLPPFSRIRPEHVVPAVEQVLAENRERIEALLTMERYTWSNLVWPMEELEDRLNRLWSPVAHLHAVADDPELRTAYNACLPKLSEYATELGQNEALYQAYRRVTEGPGYGRMSSAQKKVIDNALLDFKLSGVDLPARKKARFKAVSRELSELASRFEEHVLDATQAWKKHTVALEDLAGLPANSLALARQTADREGLDGWLITLEFPSYVGVMTHADDRELRREVYAAYTTRASDQGPNAGSWDNTPIMDRVLRLRHEQAQLIGFENFAERSLVKKMAARPEQVIDFLRDLARRSKAVAQQELETVAEFARERDGLTQFKAWDLAYYSEKLRQHALGFSQEDLRPYFPLPKVLSGLFEVVRRLYGMTIRPVQGVDVWHPDVEFYEIFGPDGGLRGRFYLDLYARPHKRGGAWMDECAVRKRVRTRVQTPVAYLTCNFTPPIGSQPALLDHDEVTTLFHEFGHGLHHLLTRMDYPSISGINGVAWDAVELPSQLFENWCWDREVLSLIAGHFETGTPLPDDLYRKMRSGKTFQAGLQMVRQLEFALFDFRLHWEFQPELGARIQDLLDEVRREVAVVQPPDFNRFAHSFSHIFAGGYAAGYYSYKWAEVLAADAFSAFEENGIFDRQTGGRFLDTVLANGGARDAMELFVAFRGREPTIDALLRQSGIAAGATAVGAQP